METPPLPWAVCSNAWPPFVWRNLSNLNFPWCNFSWFGPILGSFCPVEPSCHSKHRSWHPQGVTRTPWNGLTTRKKKEKKKVNYPDIFRQNEKLSGNSGWSNSCPQLGNPHSDSLKASPSSYHTERLFIYIFLKHQSSCPPSSPLIHSQEEF